VAAVFPFAHNETPNNTGTSPADDDIVTITTPLVNIPIVVGTDVYYFNLLGFSTNGGGTFDSVFQSPEGSSNTATLYGQLTSDPVPEPGVLTLLGVGLMLAARRLRRASHQLAGDETDARPEVPLDPQPRRGLHSSTRSLRT
jgi:hypothetical protein